MTHWPIRDVSRAPGITSRTLRHYEQIGLLRPARVAPNGYRFYGDEEISRLYRILSLRSLGLPLASIGSALEDDATLAEAITAHLALLEERRERTTQQIAAVQHTLAALTTGDTMTIEDIFAGFDAARHEGEVRERWGEDAWRRSNARRSRMSEDERRADDRRSRDVTAALRDAAAFGGGPRRRTFPGPDRDAPRMGGRPVGRSGSRPRLLHRAVGALRRRPPLRRGLRRPGQRRAHP